MNQTLLALSATAVIVFIVYKHIGFSLIKECYANWFRRDYWNSYNIVEAISWLAKSIVIIPGLLFGINIWQLYFVTLVTSAMLIWVSEKKVLPTLVGFNTLWIWLSCMALVKNI